MKMDLKKTIILCTAFSLLVPAAYVSEKLITSQISSVSAATVVDGDFKYTTNSEEKTATLVSYSGKEADVTIPSSFISEDGTEYTVTAIGVSSFSGNKTLQSVVIPSTIEKINHDSSSITGSQFKNCENLVSVKFEEGSKLTFIDIECFSGCKNLKEINLPESVKELHNSAFSGCSSLTDISLENINFIGTYVFSKCSSLKTVSIGTALKEGSATIGVDNVYGYKNGNAFQGCTSLETVNINAAEISKYDFSDCKSLKKVDFSANSTLTTIADHAFLNCTALDSVSLPGTVTILDEYAFSKCSNLDSNSINLSKIETIKSRAFNECTSLTKVNLNSITDINSYAFYNCSNLLEVNFGENLNSVGTEAFMGCKLLKSVTLPESLKIGNIGTRAFGCSGSDGWGSYYKTEGFTIYCIEGSGAEAYATKNGFNFVAISSMPEPENNFVNGVFCDVNGDGKADVMDLAILKQYLLNAN